MKKIQLSNISNNLIVVFIVVFIFIGYFKIKKLESSISISNNNMIDLSESIQKLENTMSIYESKVEILSDKINQIDTEQVNYVGEKITNLDVRQSQIESSVELIETEILSILDKIDSITRRISVIEENSEFSMQRLDEIAGDVKNLKIKVNDLKEIQLDIQEKQSDQKQGIVEDLDL